MAVSTSMTLMHPSLSEHYEDFETMSDCYKGSTHIKRLGVKYLPPIKSMWLDGFNLNAAHTLLCNEIGNRDYYCYKLRAVFPEYVFNGVTTFLGLLHNKDAAIRLTPSLEKRRYNISDYGEDIQSFLERVNEQQLLQGRLAIRLALAKDPDGVLFPYLTIYDVYQLLNWDDEAGDVVFSADDKAEQQLKAVILDESGAVFDKKTFRWVEQKQYRVLQLRDDGLYENVFENTDFTADDLIRVELKGKPVKEMPVVIVNAADLTSKVSKPPLKELADLALSVYRSEADYRQNLHFQGQDTLVITGSTKRANNTNGEAAGPAEEGIRVGANACINLDMDSDAKYIGVSGDGLSEQRAALSSDKEYAQQRAGQFVGTNQSSQESGDAMRTRITSRTITLRDIGSTGAKALSKILKIWARIIGENDELITVAENKEYVDNTISGQDLVQIVTARNLGAPISRKSIFEWCKQQGLTENSYDDELKEISVEKPEDVPPMIIEALDENTNSSTVKNAVRQVNNNTFQSNDPSKTDVDSRS